MRFVQSVFSVCEHGTIINKSYQVHASGLLLSIEPDLSIFSDIKNIFHWWMGSRDEALASRVHSCSENCFQFRFLGSYATIHIVTVKTVVCFLR